MPAGMVHLVGAGPGDPELITVRGLECIRRADVIVYDRLVSTELLGAAHRGAVLIYAGKAPGRHTLSQEQINALLVRLGREGKVVCRLKGGDPFVFGRGGEEAQALAAAGVPYTVVPGVTSAVAVPAYAGIPVTHRGVARPFTVVAGNTEADDLDSALDWEALARVGGTLVLLMAVGHLDSITGRLIAGGRSPETPAAAVQWGTRPDQRAVHGTLATLAARVAAARLAAPAVVVVGEVAALAEAIAWFPTAGADAAAYAVPVCSEA